MRPAPRKSHPRHLAGSVRSQWQPREFPGDFDVEAALDAKSEYDFHALFAGDTEVDEASAPRVRAARHKVAFAVSITIAALPILALDNFHATAESPTSTVEAAAGAAKDELRHVVTLPDRAPASEVTSVEVTLGTATTVVEEPTTTTTAEVRVAAPSTTKKPAPTTTTTAKPATTTTAQPAPPPAATSASSGGDPSDPATWEELAQCESGGNWQAVSQPRSGKQYYGGLQFSLATWRDVGGTGYPHEASKATQIEMGKRLQARQGWNAWPSCSRRLGWT